MYLAAFSSKFHSTCPRSTSSTIHHAEFSARSVRHCAAFELRLHALEHGADDFLQRIEVAAQLHAARFEARHVEQIADQAAKALGFVRDAFEQFLLGFEWQAVALRAERGGGAGDGGERSAEIVRHGAQQRTAHLLGLHIDAGLLGGALADGSFDGECGLAGEDLEQLLLFGREDSVLRIGQDSENTEGFARAT